MRRVARIALLLVVLNAAAAPPRLTDLAWLAGHWAGENDGVFSEELWTEPRGGLMLGLHRDVREGRRAFFEYLRIEETETGIVFLASPGGKPPTAFPLDIEATRGRRAVFANPGHDWPERIRYELTDDGSLIVRAEGGERTLEWRWRRVADPAVRAED